MDKQFALRKNERLRSRKTIELLFSKGKSFSLSSYRIFYLIDKIPDHLPRPSNVLFGVGVSGKNFKKAVDRNRIKRLIRESYRSQKKELLDASKQKKLQLHIFFVYTNKELPDFNTVKIKVGVALNKLLQLVKEIENS